jgi:4-amino-4-deoxy-L-arabinose transferase-like glycosyltransferase
MVARVRVPTVPPTVTPTPAVSPLGVSTATDFLAANRKLVGVGALVLIFVLVASAFLYSGWKKGKPA